MFGSSKFNLSLLGWNQFFTKIIDFCIEYNIASDTSTLRLQWGWPADSDSSRIQHIALEMTRCFPGNWTKKKRMVDCEKWKCFLPRKDNQDSSPHISSKYTSLSQFFPLCVWKSWERLPPPPYYRIHGYIDRAQFWTRPQFEEPWTRKEWNLYSSFEPFFRKS